MDWNTIVLRFIDGPGIGFTAIVLGFFAFIVFLVLIRSENDKRTAYRQGQEARRASDLELIKSQMARMVDDQKAISTRITSRPSRSRRNAVVDAEAN